MRICKASLNISIPRASEVVEFEAYFTATGAVAPESNHTHRRVPFNSAGFPYPEETDTRYSRMALAQPLLVPFPPGYASGLSIHRCANKNAVGCSERDKKFKKKLESAYLNGFFPSADTSLVGQRNAVDGHHIQPLQWGGDNSLNNGVLLTEAAHGEFTKWWNEVSGY
jgi:hypothetical protein